MYAGQEETELNMEQQTGSKSGKEYVRAVYCHPAYLFVYHFIIKGNDEDTNEYPRVVSSEYLKLFIFSPGNLDSNLCLIQPGISPDVLCI